MAPEKDVKAAHPCTKSPPGDPLDLIEAAHQLHAQICDALEIIADGLPDDVDYRLALKTADTLRTELPLHHRDEEDGLFPLLRERAKRKDNVGEILSRLTEEHQTDEGFAEELGECLDILGRGEKVGNPDMVGYMLRGFFEGYRRHLHWENTLLLPLARKRLKEDDLAELQKIFAANRRAFNINYTLYQ